MYVNISEKCFFIKNIKYTNKAQACYATHNIHISHAKDTHTYTTTHTVSLIHLLVKKYTTDIQKAKVKIGVPPWHGQ